MRWSFPEGLRVVLHILKSQGQRKLCAIYTNTMDFFSFFVKARLELVIESSALGSTYMSRPDCKKQCSGLLLVVVLLSVERVVPRFLLAACPAFLPLIIFLCVSACDAPQGSTLPRGVCWRAPAPAEKCASTTPGQPFLCARYCGGVFTRPPSLCIDSKRVCALAQQASWRRIEPPLRSALPSIFQNTSRAVPRRPYKIDMTGLFRGGRRVNRVRASFRGFVVNPAHVRVFSHR